MEEALPCPVEPTLADQVGLAQLRGIQAQDQEGRATSHHLRATQVPSLLIQDAAVLVCWSSKKSKISCGRYFIPIEPLGFF